MGDEPVADEEGGLEMGGDELDAGEPELETGDEDEFGTGDEFDTGDEDELTEQDEENSDEAIYEIELDDEDDDTKEGEVDEAEGGLKDLSNPKEVAESDGFEGGQSGLKNPKTTEPGKGKETKGNDHEGGMKDLKNGEKKEPGKGKAKIGNDHEGGQKDLKGPKTELPEEEQPEEEVDEAAVTMAYGRRGLTSKKFANAGKEGQIPAGVKLNEQFKILKEQNKQYKEALILFKDKLQEVAVFNSNLAYSTRLFTEHSTTKNEKLDILKRFDTVKTKEDSKNLFEQINGELGTKKPIAESVADKITSTPKTSSTEVLSEAKVYENPQFARIKELMFK